MLQAQSLSCCRGSRMVFRGLDFSLAAGGLLQITGANGSGKSSLLRLLAGLAPKSEGTILWQGQPVDGEHRNRLHYIGHQDGLKPELTGIEMLDYWRALGSCPAVSNPDWFGIAAFQHKPIRILSAGQKRRLALSRLTLRDVPLWLLDEPTNALDADGQKLLLAAIAAHRGKGGMVIAAVHHRLEADSVEFAMPGAA